MLNVIPELLQEQLAPMILWKVSWLQPVYLDQCHAHARHPTALDMNEKNITYTQTPSYESQSVFIFQFCDLSNVLSSGLIWFQTTIGDIFLGF